MKLTCLKTRECASYFSMSTLEIIFDIILNLILSVVFPFYCILLFTDLQSAIFQSSNQKRSYSYYNIDNRRRLITLE